MKPLVKVLFLLFLSIQCMTAFVVAAGRENNEGPIHKAANPSDELSKFLHKVKEMSFLKNLIILKDGEIIVEEYLNDGQPDQINDIRSASKSILSAVLGIAVKDGYIDSIDQKVIDFFPEYISDKLDPRIYKLRIRHLITMTSGFKIKESAAVYRQLYHSPDWIEHILNIQFNAEPGKKFNYHSFNTHLLSATISKATGVSTFAYAKAFLFSPLGISNVKWEKDPNGYHIGGWGLSMTAKDMVKLGALYLNNGRHKETQLIPAEWIRSSTTEKIGMIGTYYSGWNKSYGYGYLWWIKRLDSKIDIPFAMGHGGQRIAILPEADAVIVTQAEPNPGPSTSFKRHRAVDSLLFDDVVPYLLRYQSKRKAMAGK
jgi:CubicO group peptidase (beta-lactamase class C family)